MHAWVAIIASQYHAALEQLQVAVSEATAKGQALPRAVEPGLYNRQSWRIEQESRAAQTQTLNAMAWRSFDLPQGQAQAALAWVSSEALDRRVVSGDGWPQRRPCICWCLGPGSNRHGG